MAQHIDIEYFEKQMNHIFSNFGFELTHCNQDVFSDNINIFTGFQVSRYKFNINPDGAVGEELRHIFEAFQNSPYSKDLETTYKMEADMLREELEALKAENHKLLEALSDGMEILERGDVCEKKD